MYIVKEYNGRIDRVVVNDIHEVFQGLDMYRFKGDTTSNGEVVYPRVSETMDIYRLANGLFTITFNNTRELQEIVNRYDELLNYNGDLFGNLSRLYQQDMTGDSNKPSITNILPVGYFTKLFNYIARWHFHIYIKIDHILDDLAEINKTRAQVPELDGVMKILEPSIIEFIEVNQRHKAFILEQADNLIRTTSRKDAKYMTKIPYLIPETVFCYNSLFFHGNHRRVLDNVLSGDKPYYLEANAPYSVYQDMLTLYNQHEGFQKKKFLTLYKISQTDESLRRLFLFKCIDDKFILKFMF